MCSILLRWKFHHTRNNQNSCVILKSQYNKPLWAWKIFPTVIHFCQKRNLVILYFALGIYHKKRHQHVIFFSKQKIKRKIIIGGSSPPRSVYVLSPYGCSIELGELKSFLGSFPNQQRVYSWIRGQISHMGEEYFHISVKTWHAEISPSIYSYPQTSEHQQDILI